jgi:hypothetical protein
MLRDVLSKMYYNYGQALQAEGRLNEAAKAALARRELWRGDKLRLWGVAVELAEISRAGLVMDGSSEFAKAELDREVVATLRQVHETGSLPKFDLVNDKRFAYLRGQAAFDALVAEWTGQADGTQDEALVGARSPAIKE